MYSHVIGMDDELWDVLEDGVGNLRLDEEGVALDRKACWNKGVSQVTY